MSRSRFLRSALTGVLVAGALTPLVASPAEAITLPSGFQEQIVFSGLTQPTNIEFAPDGRVFVAEKSGRIKVFDDLADTTATLFADLSVVVHNNWDRGLLGLALAPTFPTDPSVYVLYTYDAPPGQTAPVWNDTNCDANGGACVVTARLSKLTADGNVMTGSEQVLIRDWCQQYPSHSIGDLHFGADGMLYVSGGDGASFNATDYGQLGTPSNPCGDPANEGGALRSQDVRSTADPTGLSGAILRLDPSTGLAAAGNPLIGSADVNARRIVAQGLRNPFRFAIRPGTNEVWAGDVGWNTWEEVNRVVSPTAGVTNFGWPCFEGAARMASYDNANLPLCESLYTSGGETGPYFTYNHGAKVVTGEACGTGSSSVAGVTFYPTSGGPYPAAYRGALFFADYSRNCIWAMKPATAGGLPSTSNIETFGSSASQPVDLAVGPGGELYYVDIGGSVRRIRYFPGNQPPSASISAAPTAGNAPLTVSFNGAGSSDPDPADQGRLTYAWDFTNDGTVDSTSASTSFTYATAGTYTARLTVTDTLGVTGTTTVSISAGNDAPTAVIDTPVAGTTWKVGDVITFSGHATDPQQGTLAASALAWHLRMQHCSTVDNCHSHFLQDWTGVAGGSFTAPDHEYPSYLELELVATDAQGLSHSVVRRLDPKTVNLTFASSPTGRQLTVGSTTLTAPFTVTLIQGSTTTVSAPTPQTSGATTYTYASWSDGGAQTHVITAPAAAATWTATYTASAPPTCFDSFGYVCSTESRAFVPASTVLPVTGDEDREQITLPFAFPFYGQQYTTAWVDADGLISFAAITKDPWENAAIPSTANPNAAIFAFWDDLVVDSSSSVRWQTFGTAPNRYVVVEWRNAYIYGSTAQRLDAEAILYENGGIVLNYAGLDNAAEKGQSASTGIENAAGSVGLPYSVNIARLVSGTAVVFTPPVQVRGGVSGIVTSAATGAPIAGATVTLTPSGATTTTTADGTYQLANILAGSYTVKATAGTAGCAGTAQQPVTIASGNSTVNLAVSSGADSFGYRCDAAARTFIQAGTVLPITGDEDREQVTLPFAFPFYGQNYTSMSVDANGLLSFAVITKNPWENTAIPATANPNAAIYAFWDDLEGDASSSVRWQAFGTAPNRYVVVEWRNVYPYGASSQRLNFEIILYENGDVVLNYSSLDNATERGGSATVGIENAAGTVALQFSTNAATLANGVGILFRRS